MGNIADALQEQRFELWEAHNQPHAGVLYSWTTDAVAARLAMGGYPADRLEDYPLRPRRAQIGAARSMVNEHVPFEFVTERDLAAGLAPRYRTIYVPHAIALPEARLEDLAAFVADGGRVVADVPFLLCDDFGHLFDTGPGTTFESLFGCSIADFQHANTLPRSFAGRALEGIFADVTVTDADVTRRFDPEGPAVLEHEYGEGSAALVTFEASSCAHRPGADDMESLIADLALGDARRRWTADHGTTYRLAAPDAHHYLFTNAGEARTVHVDARDATYVGAADAVSGASVPVDGGAFAVDLPAGGGRWVRAEV